MNVVVIILVFIIGAFGMKYYQEMWSIGRHYFIDITNVSSEIINNHELLRLKCDELLKEIDMNVLQISDYSFQPHGYTLLYLLSESHMSLHSWPEHGTLKMDLFTCSGKKFDNINSIKSHFSSIGDVDVKQHFR